ncbi:MAG: glycosyltransferase family 2 protein [Chloroflexi bacterium]|uniref:Glycosyltransferase family 2 protein n=1 Tax=Candidatus Chlorohelix allophototropha TaxID=3003348 RepID=A0A8T7M214_9CHLR|nr:glycosyltransferase family 2 protein [Chloroflexota bacterium]WJW67745.1 glycosyltransferase family 2 protein [Chloroflexota bacterium L227-S17]
MLEIVFGLIMTVLLGLLLPLVVYLIMLVIAGAFYRKPNSQKRSLLELERNGKYPNLVIMIPAHDEALTLPATLQHFNMLSLDRAGKVKPRIVVIADNCTDNTAELAREVGVEVYERFDTENRGKGHALRWAFEKLPQDFPAYEAVVIFDADTVPHAEFMIEAAAAYSRGVSVMQGRYDVLDPHETWRSSLTYVAFALFNHVRPLGRAVLKLSDGLKGNGMLISRKVLEKLPWNAYSLVEDIEYTSRLVQADMKVEYVPEAKLYGQAAASSKQALSQRLRWEGGRGAQARKDIPGLLKTALLKRNVAAFDRAMDLIIPPLGLLVALLIFSSLLNMLAWLLVGGAWLGWTLSLFGLSLVGIIIFVLGGLLVARVPARAYLALARAPFYIAWKLWVYVILVTRRLPSEWVRTERAKIEVQDVNQVTRS